jgi:hypothetical protein
VLFRFSGIFNGRAGDLFSVWATSFVAGVKSNH